MAMEEERQRDFRVPLISCMLCLFVTAGGVFLVLYVFVPDLSKPYYPFLALILIGSPWIFWFFTYIYTGLKACFRRADSQISRTQTNRNASSAVNSSKEAELPLAYSV